MLKTEENRKYVNAILAKVENGNAHFGKSDTSNAIACDRLYGDHVCDRAETWIRATAIDMYIGNTAPMFSQACNIIGSESDILRNNTSVKKSTKEICVTFKSIKAWEIFMQRHLKEETKKKTTKKRAKKSDIVKADTVESVTA